MWLKAPLSPAGVERLYDTISILIISCFFLNPKYNIPAFLLLLLISVIFLCSLGYNLFSSFCVSKRHCCCPQSHRSYTGPLVLWFFCNRLPPNLYSLLPTSSLSHLLYNFHTSVTLSLSWSDFPSNITPFSVAGFSTALKQYTVYLLKFFLAEIWFRIGFSLWN